MPSLRLRPRLSPDTVMAVDTVVTAAMAVATTARGLLMPSLRLMPLLRLSPATDTVMAVATDTTARGRLRLSPATATAAMVATDMAAMVATVVVMVATATARGLLSLATAMVAMVATGAMATAATAGAMATGVSYHRIRRSELSQKQNHKNSQR